MRAFCRLIPLRQRLVLAAIMLASLATEGVGLLLILPLLAVLEPGAAASTATGPVQRTLGLLGVTPRLETLLLVFVAMIALRQGIQLLREHLIQRAQQDLVDGLRHRCFKALLAAEWRWLAGLAQSDTAALLITDIARVGSGLGFAMALLGNLLMGCAALAVALMLAPGLAGVALGLALPLLGLTRAAATARMGDALSTANQAVQAAVQDGLAGLKPAKSAGAEARVLARLGVATQGLRLAQTRFQEQTSRYRAALQAGAALGLALFLYLGLRVWLVPGSDILAMVLLLARLMPLLQQALLNRRQMRYCGAALAGVERLLRQAGAAAEPVAVAGPQPGPGLLRLDTVTVALGDRPEPGLRDLTLDVPPGQFLLICGPSGAGKTTLADLLAGLLWPDQGALLLNNHPLRADQRRHWRDRVAYVPQDACFFRGTLRQNMGLAEGATTVDDLHRALYLAGAEFVLALPLGLETPLGDGGRGLSGGERQRVALARALLRRPQLLVLDEAISALDAATATQVLHRLQALRPHTTVVLISHHPAAAFAPDRVITLKEGRLA